jgi:nitrite reductase/ring-hydroxylating ferredoxin subunit
MPLLAIEPLAELPAGSLAQVHLAGADYALCNYDGALRCFDGICPHAGGPLGEGNLDGQNIVCPWHAWAFDCLTGVNDFDPDIQLKSYPVLVRDGSIFVELP